MKLWQQAILMVSLSVGYQVVFATSVINDIRTSNERSEREMRSKSIITEVCICNSLLLSVGSWMINSIMATDDGRVSSEIAKENEQLKAHQAKLFGLSQVGDLSHELVVAFVQEISITSNSIELLSGDKATSLTDSKVAQYSRFRKIQHRLERALDMTKFVIQKEQEAFSIAASASAEARKQVVIVFVLGMALNILLSCVLVFLFARQIKRRVRQLKANSALLSLSEPIHTSLGGIEEFADIELTMKSLAVSLQKSAERERTIFNGVAEVIIVLSDNYEILDVNPACIAAWGYEVEDLVGLRMAFVVPPDKFRQFLLALDFNSNYVKFESQIYSKSRIPIEIEWTCAAATHPNKFICIARDITERKKLEAMKQKLIAMVSHDIRQPVGALSLCVENLLEGTYGDCPAAYRVQLESASKNLQNLTTLVNDVLDLQKLENGYLTSSSTMILPADIINDCLNALSILAEEKHINLKYKDRCIAEQPLDSVRLNQILINLIANAIKFSPHESTVKIDCFLKEDAIFFSVSNDGETIPESDRDKIFQPFYQLANSNTSSQKGSGLGLAICSELVGRLNGKIWFESDDKFGTSFFVSLPVEIPGTN